MIFGLVTNHINHITNITNATTSIIRIQSMTVNNIGFMVIFSRFPPSLRRLGLLPDYQPRLGLPKLAPVPADVRRAGIGAAGYLGHGQARLQKQHDLELHFLHLLYLHDMRMKSRMSARVIFPPF